MKRILFVDDEPKVLEGLRRMLRSFRHDWDMAFLESGPAALAHLDTAPVDVILSDMRMPGMSGAELLREVAQRHPATARLILSGQCDRESVLQAVGPAHQFLTKPCDSETIRATVARVCEMRDRVCNDQHRRLASCVESVASPPRSYEALTDELAAAGASLDRVAAIAASDVGMTMKVLQLVNSGFFGTPQCVLDAKQAVNMLGLETIRLLATSRQAFTPLPAEACDVEVIEMLLRHSEAIARAAREIAWRETHDVAIAERARLAGWLHDVGLLVLAQQFLTEGTNLADGAGGDAALWNVQSQVDFYVHAEVGAYLAGLWGLPQCVLEPIAYHHRPSQSSDTGFTVLTAVHVADAGVHWLSSASPAGDPRFDSAYLCRLGCSHRVDAWLELCREAVAEEVFA